ncbi:hypothetical protein Tco_0854299 [Tanacetum coccineum]
MLGLLAQVRVLRSLFVCLIILSPYASLLPPIISLPLYMECDDSDGGRMAESENRLPQQPPQAHKGWAITLSGLKVASVFVLMEDLSLLRDALFLGIDSSTYGLYQENNDTRSDHLFQTTSALEILRETVRILRLRQEKVKIRALDSYEHRKA